MTVIASGAADRRPFESIQLLGMRFDCVTMESVLALAAEFIRSGKPHHIVTGDASMVVSASQDPELSRIITDADLVTPDGAGILWATRRVGTPVPAKVSGVDISERLIALSGENGWRIFFFGAAPGVADQAAVRMRERYPSAQIVGTRDGFFKPDDEPAIIAQIREARPDILLLALGIPKQEKFIARHREALGVPVMIGVGGTLDVFSGTVKRAPVWMQNIGLEWLYRTASDPKRRIKKLSLLPKFCMMALRAGKAG